MTYRAFRIPVLVAVGLLAILLMLVMDQKSLARVAETQPMSVQLVVSKPPPVPQEPIVSSKNSSFLRQIDKYFQDLPSHDHHHDGQQQQVRWIQDYLHWHYDMRIQFPEQAILDHPKAPNIVIAFHNQNADKPGGLTDRMKSLGHILQRAHQERRVLFLKWYSDNNSHQNNRPLLELEAFLVPHLMNFTLPYHNTTCTVERLKESYGGMGGGDRRRKTNNHPDTNDTRKVTLEHVTRGQHNANFLPPYGVIWHALFRPSTPVQGEIDTTMSSLGLVPGQYDAVHCRVTHPAFGNQLNYPTNQARAEDTENQYTFFRNEGADSSQRRQVEAIRAAIRGIQCAKWIANQNGFHNDHHKIYFYADSPDLVRTVVTPASLQSAEGEAWSLVKDEWTKLRRSSSSEPLEIVGRENASIAHMANKRKDTSREAFMSTFVDLYIAAQARCISLGVGRFAYMAGKISGTSCWTQHQQTLRKNVALKWGMKDQMEEVPLCNVSSTT